MITRRGKVIFVEVGDMATAEAEMLLKKLKRKRRAR